MQAGFDISFFEDIAGISPDRSGYGFKVIRFQPLFCDYLAWARATIETAYGNVSSSWVKKEHGLEWEITIPSNSSGLVAPPYAQEFTVNGEKMENCQFLKKETQDGKELYRFPSGNYKIVF